MFEVSPDKNLGHRQWESCTAPVGEQDTDKKTYWRCCSCGFVVGFWLEGHGSAPTSSPASPPENVGEYSGMFCKS